MRSKKNDPYVLYQQGLDSFDRGDYFFAEKNFQKLN